MKYDSTEGMKVFEPFDIKTMHLKNRIAIGPYGSHPAADDGSPDEKTVNYYEPLAKTGVGFVMVGIVNPIPADSNLKYSFRNNIRISEDSDIAGWKKVTDTMHKYDCRCGIQLGLFGLINRNYLSELEEQYKKYAFNDMGNGATTLELPPGNYMTTEGIQLLIKYTGLAAGRAKAAGFDCVSVHNAHSDIMFGACSLDPMFNARDDGYGGSLENRLHYTVELIKEIRKNVGPDFPITMRVNGDDLKGELGNTLEDICKYIIPELEKAGLDAIDVSQGGSMYAGQGCLPVLYYPRACWIYISSTIKKYATVPVFGVGRVTSVEMAEKILREGKVDIFYFGRQAYVDTEVIHKFMLGKSSPGDVRQCIGCDTRCFPCSMNYEAVGMRGEKIHPLEPVKKAKNVLIIGAGPAGLEAARVAAGRGHKVTLWEKSARLGGVVATLAKTPHLSEFQNAVDYLSGQMSQLGVDVRVCNEATIEKIKAFAPDTVILATGTRENIPEKFQGQPMVMGLLEAIERKREFRSFAGWHKKIWFSGFTGCEFALDLAFEGAEVTMVGPGGDSAVAAEPWFTRDRKVYLRKRLTDGNFIRRSQDTARANVRMLFKSSIESVDADGVHYYHNGIHKTAEYDAVIITGARVKNDQMFDALQSFVPEVYKIGDCSKTGIIQDAIRTANEIARVI
jgi:2,4-dienoyl-CoA reductase (NADPH2)